MGTLEVELEDQMFDDDLGIDDEEYFTTDEGSSSSEIIVDQEIDYPVDYTDAPVNSPSADVVDELLGEEEEIDLDDLSDLADDFDFDDLDDLAGDLNDEEDIDTSFIDDIL